MLTWVICAALLTLFVFHAGRAAHIAALARAASGGAAGPAVAVGVLLVALYWGAGQPWPGPAHHRPPTPTPYCSVQSQCAGLATEADHWLCVNKVLFASAGQPPDGHESSPFVYQNCWDEGWGRSTYALFGSAFAALIFSRPLVIHHVPWSSMFLPPASSSSSSSSRLFPGTDWDGRPVPPLPHIAHDSSSQQRACWQGQIHPILALAVNRSAALSGTAAPWPHAIPTFGVCVDINQVRHLLHLTCLDAVLPRFMHCLRHTSTARTLSIVELAIPFLWYLTARPAPALVAAVTRIRDRLGLPPLAAGGNPAAFGLQTPGIFWLGLHFRNFPPGFELAPDGFTPPERVNRARMVEVFFSYAQAAARHARQLAACRGQTLRVYFASDDVNLRTRAQVELSALAPVAVGLEQADVGHMACVVPTDILTTTHHTHITPTLFTLPPTRSAFLLLLLFLFLLLLFIPPSPPSLSSRSMPRRCPIHYASVTHNPA